MFDITAPITVVARAGDQGRTDFDVRWPTDEEWAARGKARKFIVKRMGRGQSETTLEAGDADLKLYEKIRQNGGPNLTAGEATRVVDVLAQCEVTDIDVSGNAATVHLEVMTGSVKHELRLPSADSVVAYRRAAYKMLELPYNKHEIRMNLEAAAALWDLCGGMSADYAGAVPALHKDVAMRALLDYLDREVAVRGNEENF